MKTILYFNFKDDEIFDLKKIQIESIQCKSIEEIQNLIFKDNKKYFIIFKEDEEKIIEIVSSLRKHLYFIKLFSYPVFIQVSKNNFYGYGHGNILIKKELIPGLIKTWI